MNKKVLLVEDEKPIQVLITYHLEKLGYYVILKNNAEDAIDYLNGNETLPAFIITDVLLPGMNGINFCRLIKNNPRTFDIPVIILSSVDYESYRESALISGADYFLTKPFRIKDFINIINNLVRK